MTKTPLDKEGKYMIVKCPYCKKEQVTSSRKRFTCFRCGKSTQIIKHDPKIGTFVAVKVIFSSDNPRDCTKAIQEHLNKKIEEYNNERN